MTLFDSYSNDGVSAVIGVQHTSPKSRGGLVTLFDSYYNDGVIAAFGVQHTSPKSGGRAGHTFWFGSVVIIVMISLSSAIPQAACLSIIFISDSSLLIFLTTTSSWKGWMV